MTNFKTRSTISQMLPANTTTTNFPAQVLPLRVTAWCGILLLCLSGCATPRVSLREIREYDQAIGLAEKNGIDTTEMRKKLVEMLLSYLENPGVDPVVQAQMSIAEAQQMQGVLGVMALQQNQQVIDNTQPMPMTFNEWRNR